MPPRVPAADEYDSPSPLRVAGVSARGSPGSTSYTVRFGEPQADVGRARSASEERPAGAYDARSPGRGEYSPTPEGTPPRQSDYSPNSGELHDYRLPGPGPEPEPEPELELEEEEEEDTGYSPEVRRSPPMDRQVSSTEPAKDKSWEDLSDSERERAKRLGWKRSSWNDDTTRGQPLNKEWNKLTESEREDAVLLGFAQQDYMHGPESQIFWQTILELQSQGKLGWSIIKCALEPELNGLTLSEKTEQLAGDWEELKQKHEEDELFKQVIECLRKLEELEKTCKMVSDAARDNSDFDEMMRAAERRDDLAAEILKVLEGGRNPLLRSLRDDLAMLHSRKAQIEERWNAVERGEDDFERDAQDTITARSAMIKQEEWISRFDIDKAMAEFCHERYGFRDPSSGSDPSKPTKRGRPENSGSQSVLGPEIQDAVDTIKDLSQKQMAYFQDAVSGVGVNKKDAAKTVDDIEKNFKQLWTKLDDAVSTAGKLYYTARDFMASQHQRVTGTPWKGTRENPIGSIDPDGVKPPNNSTQWRLETKLAGQCMRIMDDDPTRMRTICGLSTLIGILAHRAAQLTSLPQRVKDRNARGTLIEHKDYEINVLQHEAWTLVNRMQERDHMEALEEHRKTSKSLFPPSRSAAVPPPLEDTEEEIRRKYAVKHTELNTQIKAVAQLRAELTALRTEDHLRVSLTELEHEEFQRFCASDEADVRGRLVYPERLFDGIHDCARRNHEKSNPTMSRLTSPSITKQAFHDYYYECVRAAPDS